MKRTPERAQVDDPDDFVITDAEIGDWERQSRECNFGPLPQSEISELLAGLDDLLDPHFQPDPIAAEPDWLVLVRELARKHGPFSTAHIIRIVPILMAGPDTTAESNL